MEVDALDMIDRDGWERLRKMFEKDELNRMSPDLYFVNHSTGFAMLAGGLLGGIRGGRNGLENFIKQNEATVFYNKLDGRRRLNDYIFVQSMRGAIHNGLRIGMFTGMFFLFSTCSSVYRNNSSVADYTFGGGLAGSLFKVNLGPKGMFAGGIVGTLFGTVAGLAILSITKLWGKTMEELRHFPHTMKYQQELDNMITNRTLDPLLENHDQNVTDVKAEPTNEKKQ